MSAQMVTFGDKPQMAGQLRCRLAGVFTGGGDRSRTGGGGFAVMRGRRAGLCCHMSPEMGSENAGRKWCFAGTSRRFNGS